MIDDGDEPRRRWAPYVAAALLGVAFVAVWEYIVSSGRVHAIVLPAPSAVAKSLGSLTTQGFLYGHLFATVKAALFGFVIGSALGFALGIALGVSEFTRRALSPYIVVFFTLPKVALAPIFVTWFGFGISSKIVMSAVICFFPVFVDTLSGLWLVDDRSLTLLRSLKASRGQILRKLSLPTALPNIFAGLKTGITLALVGVVVGEFVGTRQGIGYLIELYSFQLQIADVFTLILLLGLIGWALYATVDFIDRRVVFWREGRIG
ncbi:MAG: ABC transporter permease [Acidimicrobiia bacterium]